MYIFGIDIPLVEIILALGVIGIILLLEITIVLLLITYLMKRSRNLEGKIGGLITALASLNKAELKELDKIRRLEETEKGIISRLRKVRILKITKPAKKRKAPVRKITPKQRKKLYETFVSKPRKSKVLEAVDKFLKGWKK